jgi:hypothetical protein
VSMSQGLLRVREAAAKDKSTRFTSLLHITVKSLESSYYALKRNATPGIDGRTWSEFQSDIAARLEELHARIHRGSYRTQPSLRVYIPNPMGRNVPLVSHRWKIKSSNMRSRKSFRLYMRLNFVGSPTDSGRNADATMRWTRFMWRLRGRR